MFLEVSNLPKKKTRKNNDHVASRTRSKPEHTDQTVEDRTRSKLQVICNKGSGTDMGTNHNCLVEWNNINKSQS
jgi:hypothetical protein